MDSLAALTGGAPVSGLLLAVMVGASVIGLIAAPAADRAQACSGRIGWSRRASTPP